MSTPLALGTERMKLLKLTLAWVGASTLVSALLSQPANAQYYGNGSDWRQPQQRGQHEPSRNESHNGLYPPVIRQPDFDTPRETPSNRGFGHGSGSYFGW